MRLHGAAKLAIAQPEGVHQGLAVETPNLADAGHCGKSTGCCRPEKPQPGLTGDTEIAGSIDAQNLRHDQILAADAANRVSIRHRGREDHRHRMDDRLLMHAVVF